MTKKNPENPPRIAGQAARKNLPPRDARLRRSFSSRLREGITMPFRWWWQARWRRWMTWGILVFITLFSAGAWHMTTTERFRRISDEGWARMSWREFRLVWALTDSTQARLLTGLLRKNQPQAVDASPGVQAAADRWVTTVTEQNPFIIMKHWVDDTGLLIVLVGPVWGDFTDDQRLLLTGEMGAAWRLYLSDLTKVSMTGAGSPGVIVVNINGQRMAQDLDGTVSLLRPATLGR